MQSARAWVEQAIATGHDPRLVQTEDGWEMRTALRGITGPLPPMPKELCDELIEACRELGCLFERRSEKREAAS
jgi:hypothetical protein